MSDVIKVAVCGFGKSGRIFHAPLIEESPQFELHTIQSSRREEVLSSYPNVQIASTIDEVCESKAIDLVVVGVPNHLHFSYAWKALKAGKHVLLEKPIATKASEAAELISFAASQQKILTVFQNRRLDCDFQTVKSLIHLGALGDLYHFESRMDRFRPEPKQGWKEEVSVGGGNLYDLGSHLIDQVLQLFGVPEKIVVDMDAQRSGCQNTDYFSWIMQYGKMRCVIGGSNLLRPPFKRFTVHGSLASFLSQGVDPQESLLERGVLPGQPAWNKEQDLFMETFQLEEGVKLDKSNIVDYGYFYECLYETIRSGQQPLVKAEESTLVLKLIEDAYEAIDIGSNTIIPGYLGK